MKRERFLGLAVTLIAAGLLVVACNKGNDNAPQDTGFMPSTVGSTVGSTNAPAPEPSPAPESTPDPCEGDASCGKHIEAEFQSDWSLEMTSTNAHDNNGRVCATDGFQGPSLGWYPWHVDGTPNPEKPSVSITPFNGDAMKISDWKEGECSREVELQLDTYRGDQCSGWIVEPGGVLFPSSKTRFTINREPGDWKVIKEWTEWGDPGACERSEVGANTVDQQCSSTTYGVKYTQYGRMCSEETRTKEEKVSKTESCECPCDPFSQLVLTADPKNPKHGNSFFKYHVFQQVGDADVAPGIFGDDILIFNERMRKGETAQIPVPADGERYYAFYDAEIWAREFATASCELVVQSWDLSLRYECGCRGDR